MTTPKPPARSGIAGVLAVFCIAALLAGVAFDFAAGAGARFWLAGQPGAAAALGVGSAVAAVLVGRLLRIALNAQRRSQGEERDASVDA